MAKKNKKLSDYAKHLTRLSLEDGRVSAERVSAVLQVLRDKEPRHFRALLKLYRRNIEREVRHSQVFVEYAGELAQATLDSIAVAFSKHFDRELELVTRAEPKLIGGLRVRVGDHVFENSAAARLQALAQRFHD